ncbi:inorganic triphosphatase [Parendozoicomonas haliclonae]|uniref:CYTH domain protein n=1 Tax=Parendozoicomonas haliclonae TaxID=1960125 RepID=A0A1X7AG24_9GAMM|nr:CYTH domain-containing protein [Parendozoicomonas haliclonae]SMA39126.1 CYTH domain protein [Parendozoicomonas haliclonae]
MSHETELKLRLSPDDHDRIIAAPCLSCHPRVTLQLTNTYYDTPDHDLNNARVALRIREKNGNYIQTLKTKGESVGGLSRRGEWEWYLDEPQLDLQKLNDVWPESLANLDKTLLQPVFRTDFRRQMVDIIWEGAEIEVALDLGDVIAGDKTSFISELELELKKGDEEALFSLAKELGTLAPLTPCDISKAEQGYRLADENCDK